MSTNELIVTALETAHAFIADELEMRRQSFLPDPDTDEAGYIASAENALKAVNNALARARGPQ